ncbi:transformer-2 sex-determining protein-like [Drosophila innubila]|uniref:transformer-2 sex-determining protein-like n=1 Tax=Drosophila innubila TaxID=198719 RepID=UPI00148DE298|nr:transformer-2 sex-determining protein-like [Drosophila innubila]
MYFNSRADSKFHGRHSNYNSKFNPQHRRRFRSPSPPVRKYRNRESSDLKRSSRSSRCIGVFGMSPDTTQDTLYNVFKKFGPIERIQMVNFTHTFVSRGFCFIYFENLYDACMAKDACSGMEVDGRSIRVDYAYSQRVFTPTPGVYMGRPSSVSHYRNRERSQSHQRYSTSSRPYHFYRQRQSNRRTF